MDKFKLGKKTPSKKDSVLFGDFLLVLPTTPLVDFAPNYVYPMDLNDTYGDCVVAGFDHSRQIITGLLGGTQKNFTTVEIEALYKTQNPNFPAEDNGMDIQTFLEYLVANKYILGFAKIDHTNDAQMKAAMYLGLSIMTGVQLQEAQQTQFASGTWDYAPNSPIEGGHCINGCGYNTGIYDVVSWGKLIAATSNFISKQMDEAWFILMQEHIDHPEFRTHFNLPAFANAVSQITGGKVVIPLHSTVRMGSKGSDVVVLQTGLNKYQPGLNLVTDGNFGSLTQKALISFQSFHNLTPDGVAGPMVWQAFSMIDIITAVCIADGVEPLLGIAIASCESSLNPIATLFNPPSNSTDRGIFQWNSVYHKEVTDDMAFDPTSATQVFCKTVLAGQLKTTWPASMPCWSKKLTPEIKAKYGIV